jgi:hypothetical protein
MPKDKRKRTGADASPYAKPSAKSAAAHSIFKMDKDLGQHIVGVTCRQEQDGQLTSKAQKSRRRDRNRAQGQSEADGPRPRSRPGNRQLDGADPQGREISNRCGDGPPNGR